MQNQWLFFGLGGSGVVLHEAVIAEGTGQFCGPLITAQARDCHPLLVKLAAFRNRFLLLLVLFMRAVAGTRRVP